MVKILVGRKLVKCKNNYTKCDRYNHITTWSYRFTFGRLVDMPAMIVSWKPQAIIIFNISNVPQVFDSPSGRDKKTKEDGRSEEWRNFIKSDPTMIPSWAKAMMNKYGYDTWCCLHCCWKWSGFWESEVMLTGFSDYINCSNKHIRFSQLLATAFLHRT
jgi:hypothetical protein